MLASNSEATHNLGTHATWDICIFFLSIKPLLLLLSPPTRVSFLNVSQNFRNFWVKAHPYGHNLTTMPPLPPRPTVDVAGLVAAKRNTFEMERGSRKGKGAGVG